MDTSTYTGVGYPALTSGCAYYCQRCKRWYVRGNVSCSVYHADGHCHYGDREVTVTEVKPQRDAAKGGE